MTKEEWITKAGEMIDTLEWYKSLQPYEFDVSLDEIIELIQTAKQIINE